MFDKDYFWKVLKVGDVNYRISPKTEFPVLYGLPRAFEPPAVLLDFKQAKKKLRRNRDRVDFGVHLYVDDKLLERFNRNFDGYLEEFRNVQCVLTPDFSIIPAMDPFCKRIAVYRSRKLGYLLQRAGVNVVPTLQWEDEDAYDFCFNDLPKRNVVSISTVSVACKPPGSKEREIFRKGFQEALKRLEPRFVMLYGTEIPECEFGDIPYRVYPDSHFPVKSEKNRKEVENGR